MPAYVDPAIVARGRRRELIWSWVSVFGLAGVAVAVPMLRVLAPHPEFFVAHEVSRAGVVAYAAVLAVALPAAAATAATIAGRFAPRLRTVLVGAIAVVAGAGFLQPLAAVAAFPMILLAVAAAVAVTERRSEAARSGLAACGVFTLLVAAWFVGPSRTGSYVWSDGEVETAGAVTERAPSPVVFIVLDEFPATALLGSDLSINRDRFPSFARLADQSDWFRLASSVSPQTSSSVPALLSGRSPTTAIGVASQYPSNLFLQLGQHWTAYSYEPVTALCPVTVCSADRTAEESAARSPSGSGKADGLGALVHDSFVVLGHTVGPDGLKRELPPVNHSWAGFRSALNPVVAVGPESDGEPGAFGDLHEEGTFAGARTALGGLLAQRPPDGSPPLYVAHLITPHLPYTANPSGTAHPPRELAGITTSNAALTWPADSEGFRRQGYQRLVMQLGAVDAMVGEVIAQLEGAGLWDEAAVVVTADHGASFEVGAFREVEVGGAEVWNVPLFVKHPGQREGTVRDEAALTIDAVPTLLSALGVRSPSRFDGIDLDGGAVPASREGAYVVGDRAITIDQSLDELRSVVERRSRWVDPDGGWDPVFRVGPGGELVGQPVDGSAFSEGGGSWRPDGGDLSAAATVTGLTLTFDTVDDPQGVVVAAGDVFVGSGAPLRHDGGSSHVTVVLDERALVDHAGPVDVFAVDADGKLHRLGRG